MRCMHEKMMHAESAFLTLTYADRCIPKVGDMPTLVKRDLQLFMKRLRKVRPVGLRFFACGEYGEVTFRPHYHVLLFNSYFRDARSLNSRSPTPLYASAELDGLWSNGNCVIGEVTFDSCAYVARYTLKKVNGDGAAAHYAGREPEFLVMSRKPGIGANFFSRYYSQLDRDRSAVVNGRDGGLPRYYSERFIGPIDPAREVVLERERLLSKWRRMPDETSARRFAREQFEYGKARTFSRSVV